VSVYCCYCLSLLLPRALKESGLDDSIKVVERNGEDEEKGVDGDNEEIYEEKEGNKAAGGARDEEKK
jgi:hypothetical protein